MEAYYQIQTTIDSKIIGRCESPLTVEIKNKIFSEQSNKYFLDVNKYFEDQNTLYEKFPIDLKGKMFQKKKLPIDIMNVMPYYISLEYVISKKIKDIFERLEINKDEYHLEELSIDGSEEKFYFLFIPLLKSSEYVDYEKSIFYDSLNDKSAIFGNYEKYLDSRKFGNYRAKTLCLKKELYSRDIISVQAGGPFYSERIIDAFKEENIIGYDIIERGDFKIDLHFT